MIYFYRCYERHWDEEIETRLIVAKMPVLRETAKTVVLNYFGTEKRVLKDARKRFAYPTVELALESYIKRKDHHIRRLEYYLDCAKAGRRMAEAIQAGARPMPFIEDGGQYFVHHPLPGAPKS